MATLEQMYTPQAFSPQTALSQDIGASDTRIYVANVNVFPTPPTLATIGTDAASAETVKITAKGTNYIDVQRGLLGTAKSWTTNSVIARNFSAADQTAIQNNINTLNTLKLESVEADDVVNNTLTNDKLAKVATNTLKGRKSANQGDVEDLTVAQVLSMLNVSAGADKTVTILEALSAIARYDESAKLVVVDSTQAVGSQVKYLTVATLVNELDGIYAAKSTKINSKSLANDITLTASDVGAAPASSDLTNGGSIVGDVWIGDDSRQDCSIALYGTVYLYQPGDSYFACRIQLDGIGDYSDASNNPYYGRLSFLAGNAGTWGSEPHAKLAIGEPVDAHDATTKNYVDSLVAPLQLNSATSLPASGSALTANTLYNVSSAVTTYNFVSPSLNGWAHGIFIAGTSPNITFSGTIIGKLPTFEADKTYEFDVFANTWIVQEIVSQS